MTTHYLTVERPFDLDRLVEDDGHISAVVRRIHPDADFAGSGAGFGFRDIDYFRKGRFDLDKLKPALEALNIPNLSVTTYTDQESPDDEY